MEILNQLITDRPQLIDDITEPVDVSEVLRYLGYPAGHDPAARIAKLLEKWLPEASGRAAPKASYLILPVLEQSNRSLIAQASPKRTVEIHGAIGQFLAASQLIVAFIATAGPRVEKLASQLLANGEELPAMIVNAVGAERAEAAEAAVIAHVTNMARPHGLTTTLPYSPGYCGMALTEQRTLFGLFDGKQPE